MVDKNGNAYGKVTRNMVDNLAGEFRGFRKDIKQEFSDMKKLNVELYNHLSSRLPVWVTILFTILGSIVVGLIVAAVK